jgi:putative transposase
MTATEQYRQSRYVVSAFHAHLVFVAKQRQRVLTGEHICYLNDVFGKVCGGLSAVLAECNGEDDHVHLLAGYTPKVPVAALVNSLKVCPRVSCAQWHRIRTHCDHPWSPSISLCPAECAAIDHPAIRRAAAHAGVVTPA